MNETQWKGGDDYINKICEWVWKSEMSVCEWMNEWTREWMNEWESE